MIRPAASTSPCRLFMKARIARASKRSLRREAVAIPDRTSLAGDNAQLPRRTSAAQQGAALSRRSANRGRDRRSDARGTRRPTATGSAVWWSCSGAAACALPKRCRSASATSIPGAARCWCATARAVMPARSAWTPGGWEQLRPWLAARLEFPVGPLFCVIDGPTRGRLWSSANVRVEFRRLAAQVGIRRRFAPHQLRHAPRRSTCRASTPKRSSPPSTPGAHR
jgi:hypothetical protein